MSVQSHHTLSQPLAVSGCVTPKIQGLIYFINVNDVRRTMEILRN